jgi:hypothetical protein
MRTLLFRGTLAALAAGILVATPDAWAQKLAPAPAPATVAPRAAVVDTVLRVRGVDRPSTRFGGRVVVRVDNLERLPRTGPRSADSLLLFVSGYAIPDAHPKPASSGGSTLTFKLENTPSSREVWSAVLADSVMRARTVAVSVGFRGGPAAPPVNPSRPVTIRFAPFTALRFYVSTAGFLIALAGFTYMVFRSGILRDSPEESGRPINERPYSLGRAQGAAWFFAIVAAFLYIRLVTNDYDSLTTQALLLLGVGTATQAASGLVDNSLRGKARAALARLRPLIGRTKTEVDEMEAQARSNPGADPAAMALLRTTLAGHRELLAEMRRELAQAEAVLRGGPSRGFVVDLVSDAQGVSLHRFQMAVWTVILIAIYLTEVVVTWAMPTFNPEMLALMGFSGTAFVGFKLVERQPAPSQTGTDGAPADAPADPISPQVYKVISDLHAAGTPAGGENDTGAPPAA